MSDNNKIVEAQTEQQTRSEWQRPEFSRIDADEAGGAGGFGLDNVVYS
ncbi:MAG TPA: hypothetical protein VF727_15755 [Allosphingosinicella sp.]|jgi:hypothetical protein